MKLLLVLYCKIVILVLLVGVVAVCEWSTKGVCCYIQCGHSRMWATPSKHNVIQLLQTRPWLNNETKQVHHIPQNPAFASFSGRLLHSSRFKWADGTFRDQRVLVVGGGESAADIAAEITQVAKEVHMSIRNGVWFHDRYVFSLLCQSVHIPVVSDPRRIMYTAGRLEPSNQLMLCLRSTNASLQTMNRFQYNWVGDC